MRTKNFMRIGIAGPFNPIIVKDYLPKNVTVPNINMAATSVNLYVRALLQLGHSVTVFTSYPQKGKSYCIKGKRICVHLISSKFNIKGFGRARMPHRIRKEIEKEIDNLDILHAEWTYEYAYAIKKYHSIRPIYCSVRDWCPYLLTLANGWVSKYYWYMSYMLFLGVMNQREFRFIANSTYTERQILSKYPEAKVFKIPNPLLEEYVRKERADYPENTTFVSISQSLLEKRKNYKSLLLAFRKYREYRPKSVLKLIGNYTMEWKKNMTDLGLLDGVDLLGSVSHDQVFTILDQVNCLIHPSLEETFGNILLEAMCRRVICIGGENSGAVPEVLGYGKYGILCDVTKPDSIVQAMLEMEDNSKFQAIVEKCTDYILENYTETIIAQNHIDLFES